MLNQLQINEEIPKRLEKEEINGLPIIRFRGPVKFAETTESCQSFVRTLKSEKVLGFDIECKPNFKKGPNSPPALLQLATSSQAYLFRLYPVMKLGPLIEILEDPNIIKTGVALKDDMNKSNPFLLKVLMILPKLPSHSKLSKLGSVI
mgnify:CR=1 FL=1